MRASNGAQCGRTRGFRNTPARPLRGFGADFRGVVWPPAEPFLRRSLFRFRRIVPGGSSIIAAVFNPCVRWLRDPGGGPIRRPVLKDNRR